MIDTYEAEKRLYTESPAFIEAFENHTGAKYDPPGGGEYKAMIRDFKAGWDACHAYLHLCWKLLPDIEHPDVTEIKEAYPWRE